MTLLTYQPPKQLWLDILYHDQDILLVNKPSGLLSVPGNKPEFYDSATTRVKDQFGFTEPVHRLDMATSGILLFAMNKQVEKELKRQFRHRETHKIYEALLWGNLEEKQGYVNLPLVCDWENRPRQRICFINGKKSYTEFKLLENYSNNTCRVELIPKTGRSHQLRIHMLALSHPILGDKFYAHPKARELSPRLTLHARELFFKHPTTKEFIHIISKVPF